PRPLSNSEWPRATRAPAKSWRAMVDLPKPEGPVIRPTFQDWSARGRSTSQLKREKPATSRSKREAACRLRGVGAMGDSTVMRIGCISLLAQAGVARIARSNGNCALFELELSITLSGCGLAAQDQMQQRFSLPE